jgi:ATP-dependent RNA helicase DDX52/ROK1
MGALLGGSLPFAWQAVQIKREFERFAAKTKLQVRLLDKANATSGAFAKRSSQKFDVLISTPMRLVKALQAGQLVLTNVHWLVFDEVCDVT